MGRSTYKGNNRIDDAATLTVLAVAAIGTVILIGPKLIIKLIKGKK